MLALQPPTWVPLGKCLALSEPLFPTLQVEVNRAPSQGCCERAVRNVHKAL